MTDKDEALSRIEADLAAAGHPCIRESFRMPAWPWISPATGFFLSAAGGFALASGRAGLAFLLGIAGAAIILLDACGFSPLDWIGPKVRSRILVIPGTPSGKGRTAFFVGIPLVCSPPGTVGGVLGSRWRRISYLLGVALTGSVALLSFASALLFLPPLPAIGVAAGTALLLPLAASGPGKPERGLPRNRAADWAARLAAVQDETSRPFLFVYPGDPAGAKFLLARYRGPLIRGCGVFIEFPEGATGPIGVARAEGPLVPYRVDPALLDGILAAGRAAGIATASSGAVRRKTAALFAMARGFRAATLFQEMGPSSRIAVPDDAAARWVLEITKARGKPNGLTGGGEGV